MEASPSESSATMPIVGVTLYDNGYAVFQRETTIQGQGHIDLYFPQDIMRSVLDSLQFLGDAAQHVGNIAYEARKPKASYEIDETRPLVSLIKSLVGSSVKLQVRDGESVCGRVLGVDTQLVAGDAMKVVPHVSVMYEGGVLASYPVNEVRSISLIDQQTQKDVAFSLDLAKTKAKEDMQKLSVFYSVPEGSVCCKLVAQYGFKISEWKSSYRMGFDKAQPDKFLLHGLAIVENSLWEDWNNVKLTLVVGAPAIHSDKEEKDEGVWLLTIKTLDGGNITVRANPKDSVLSLKEKIAKKKGTQASSFKLVFCGKTVEDGRQLSDYTIGNNAVLHMNRIDSRSTSLGQSSASSRPKFVMAAQDNLSYYPIPMHVTAQRKQKAIVTMLQTNLEGQHVVLYDETIRKGNPLAAVLFENTTGRTLEGGTLNLSTDGSSAPLEGDAAALPSGSTFLGQGSLPTLSPGDESPPIPYAVELGCEVIKSADSTFLKPHRIEISNGNFSIFRIHRERTLYRIFNRSDKTLDFLLNHLFLEDYDLVQNPNVEEEEPVDITDRFYQFRFTVDAKVEKKTFTVTEEITDMKQHGIKSLDEDEYTKWVQRGAFSTEVEAKLGKTFALRKQIKVLSTGILEKESEVREINRNQDHIRENITTLEHHSKQASKYIVYLEEEETKLKATQDAIKTDRSKQQQLQKELNSLVSSIEYTKDLTKK